MSIRIALASFCLILLACPPAEEPVPAATPEPTPVDVLATYRGGPVDLSGPLTVGRTTVVSGSTRSWGITRLPGLGTLDKGGIESRDYTVEILAVEDGQPTRVRVSYQRLMETSSLKPEGAEAVQVEIPLPLHGVTEIQELVDGRWKRAIEGGVATPEQELLMRPSSAQFASRERWYPNGVEKGASWKLEGADLVGLLGGLVTEEPKGSIEVTLVELLPCDGSPCARLRIDGRVRAKMYNPEDPRQPIRVTLDITGSTLRTLDTSINVADSFSGTIESAGRLPVEDQLVDFTLNGRIEGTSSARLK